MHAKVTIPLPAMLFKVRLLLARHLADRFADGPVVGRLWLPCFGGRRVGRNSFGSGPRLSRVVILRVRCLGCLLRCEIRSSREVLPMLE